MTSAEYMAQWRKRYPDKALIARERDRLWRQTHPRKRIYTDETRAQGRERMRLWAANNPDKVKARNDKHHEKYKHRELAYAKMYFHTRRTDEQKERHRAAARNQRLTTHPDKIREWRRRYQDKHHDELLAKKREWNKKNPDKLRLQALRRRCLEKNAPGTFTWTQWLELIAQYQNACGYCGITDQKMTMDHRLPLVRGGSNWIENIIPACWPCNRRKNRRTEAEFRKLIVTNHS